MSFCNCRCGCTLAAFIASLITGIITAFLQITAVITVTPVFLWVTFGIAAGYLALLLVSSVAVGRSERSLCGCSSLSTVLLGILGTILFSLILLAVGIVATSVVSAILVGIVVFFFILTLTGTACLTKALTSCER